MNLEIITRIGRSAAVKPSAGAIRNPLMSSHPLRAERQFHEASCSNSAASVARMEGQRNTGQRLAGGGVDPRIARRWRSSRATAMQVMPGPHPGPPPQGRRRNPPVARGPDCRIGPRSGVGGPWGEACWNVMISGWHARPVSTPKPLPRGEGCKRSPDGRQPGRRSVPCHPGRTSGARESRDLRP
jgi:hypothetical protein